MAWPILFIVDSLGRANQSSAFRATTDRKQRKASADSKK
jgi:hypothetical protein